MKLSLDLLPANNKPPLDDARHNNSLEELSVLGAHH